MPERGVIQARERGIRSKLCHSYFYPLFFFSISISLSFSSLNFSSDCNMNPTIITFSVQDDSGLFLPQHHDKEDQGQDVGHKFSIEHELPMVISNIVWVDIFYHLSTGTDSFRLSQPSSSKASIFTRQPKEPKSIRAITIVAAIHPKQIRKAKQLSQCVTPTTTNSRRQWGETTQSSQIQQHHKQQYRLLRCCCRAARKAQKVNWRYTTGQQQPSTLARISHIVRLYQQSSRHSFSRDWSVWPESTAAGHCTLCQCAQCASRDSKKGAQVEKVQSRHYAIRILGTVSSLCASRTQCKAVVMRFTASAFVLMFC